MVTSFCHRRILSLSLVVVTVLGFGVHNLVDNLVASRVVLALLLGRYLFSVYLCVCWQLSSAACAFPPRLSIFLVVVCSGCLVPPFRLHSPFSDVSLLFCHTVVFSFWGL